MDPAPSHRAGRTPGTPGWRARLLLSSRYQMPGLPARSARAQRRPLFDSLACGLSVLLLSPVASFANSSAAESFAPLDAYMELTGHIEAMSDCLQRNGAFGGRSEEWIARMAASPRFDSLVRAALSLLEANGWSGSSAHSAAQLGDIELRAAGVMSTLSQFAQSGPADSVELAMPRHLARAIQLVAFSSLVDGACEPSPELLEQIRTLSDEP